MSQPLAVDNCPSNYTTPNGLSFQIRCNVDRPNLNDLTHFQADNIQDCLNHCSTNPDELCGGAEFQSDTKTCWLKTSNVTAANNVTASSHGIFAVANKTQLQPLPSACANDGQIATSKNGLAFLIHCSEDMPGADLCPDAAPDCRFHADSLEECMAGCSTTHPLCAGVAWDWSQVHGYANCYPKALQPNGLDSFRSPSGDSHSAIAQFTNGTDDCSASTDKQFLALNSDVFALSCNLHQSGVNLTVQHEATMEDCINSCAEYRNDSSSASCNSVVYDAYMTNGFENCYLLPDQGSSGSSQSGFTFASLTTTPKVHGSKSKAWIAGVVVGVVAAIAIAAAAFWLFKGRRKRRDASEYKGVELGDTGVAEETLKYRYEKRVDPAVEEVRVPHHELPGHGFHEMDGFGVSELPGDLPLKR